MSTFLDDPAFTASDDSEAPNSSESASTPSDSPINDDGADLLDDTLELLTKYVAFANPLQGVAVALWIVATHALPAFEFAPRLAISGPTKQCGKSRLLDIIGGTCHQQLATVNATVAAIFRSIGGEHPPTLIIDEADTIFGTKRAAEENEGLRALLNAGHQRGRTALRCVGPQQTPTEFPIFAMAALAGIGALPDTITDRAVNITMRRRSASEKVSQFRARRDGPVLFAMRCRLADWAAANLAELSDSRPEMPVDDRAADTWEPLIAIADLAGGRWPSRARAACLALVGAAGEADEEANLQIKLLADVKKIFDDEGVPFLTSRGLVHKLRELEDSPWNDFDINPSKLAYRLKDFGVRPQRDTIGNARGYRLEDLKDAFRRYLRQNVSDRQETTTEQEIQSDGSNASDGSECQTEFACQTEPALQDTFPDDLTGSDGPPDHGGSTPRCDCGEDLRSAESITAGRCAECRLTSND